MAKIIKWMKTIGSALLTGAKAVTVAEGMVGNLVAEGIGELFEQGFHSVGEKIKQNQLFKSAESKFEKLALTYGEDFLQELYRDLCKSTGNTQEKKKSGASCKDYAKLFFSSMDSVNEKTLSALPCCQKLSDNDKTTLIAALLEFKEWLTQRLYSAMTFKEKTFAQIVAQKVVNELGGELKQVFKEICSQFYGDEIEPLTECPNCHAAENNIEYKKAEKLAVCKNCGKSFYVGKPTKQAKVFQAALEKTLKDVETEIAAIDARLCEIEKSLAVLSNENEKRKWNARINLRYAVKVKNPDPDRVEAAAQELRKFDPNDPFALYFIYALQDDRGDVCSFLEQTYFGELNQEERQLIAKFAIGGLKHSTEISSVRVYLKGAFTEGTNEYQEYQQWLDEEAAKTYDGVYDVDLERDAFIMYVSEDLPLVRQLVCFLEGQGLKCFYSERNLQHIYKRKESRYMEKIMKAMDNCKTIVFVSTETARSKYDGGHIDEMKRRIECERNFARRQYNNNNLSYDDIRDDNIKKPRIEWVVGTPRDVNVQRNIYIKQFFGDLVNGGVTMDVIADFVFEHSIPSGESAPAGKTSTTTNASPAAISSAAKNTQKPVSATVTKQTPIAHPSPAPTPKANVQPKPADKNLGKLYNYNVLEDGTAELVLLKGAETLYLPTTVDGYKVTKISKGEKFKNQNIINKIIIPKGVLTIAQRTFSHCKNLTTVTIPNSVTSIGWGSFFNCERLTNITIPNGVTSIDQQVFAGCSSLTNITIPNGVTSIDQQAFAGCSSLTSLTIPNNVKFIGLFAFSSCTSLTNITIPYSVTSIADFAFNGCDSLKNIAVATNNKNYQSIDGNLYSKDGKKLIQYAIGKTAMFFAIPNGVTEIESCAFSGCKNLINVTIPNSVIKIGYSSFKNCSNLVSIQIPNSVKHIRLYAFHCKQKKLTVYCEAAQKPSGWEDKWNNGVKKVVWGYKPVATTQPVTATRPAASKNRSAKKRSIKNIFGAIFGAIAFILGVFLIVYPWIDPVVFGTKTGTAWLIADIAFSLSFIAFFVLFGDQINAGVADSSLGLWLCGAGGVCLFISILLPIATKPESVFYEWYYWLFIGGILFFSLIIATLTWISEGDKSGFKSFFGWLMIGLFLTALALSVGVPVHHKRTYKKNEDAVKASYTYTALENDAAELVVCKGAETLEIPSVIDGYRVTKISCAENVKNASAVKTLVLPETVVEFSPTAFGNYINLVNVRYTGSLENWCALSFYSAQQNPMYYAENLYIDGELLTDLVIPETVTTLDNYSFYGCESLQSVTLGENVIFIAEEAFACCNNITEATAPAFAVKNFPKENLKTVTITSGETIEKDAFLNCVNLTSVTLPDNLNSIEAQAFKDCANLKDVVIPNTVTEIGKAAFNGCKKLTNVTIPQGVTVIEDYAFYNCSGLTDITIPDSVTSIANTSFSGCSALQNATLPLGAVLYIPTSNLQTLVVTSGETIADSAFLNCEKLTTVTLPESVTEMGFGAFSGCKNLKNLTVPFVGNTQNGATNTHFGYIFGANFYLENKAHVPAALENVTVLKGNLSGKRIMQYSFYNCDGLTRVTLPDGIVSIEDYAFYGCKALASVNIPETVTEIGEYAFYECEALTSVNIPDGVTAIGDSTFYACRTLENVEIPHLVTSIGKNAFFGCRAFTSVTLGANVASVGENAFYGCFALKEATLLDGVISIDDYAFARCFALTDLTIPESVTSVGDNAFAYCSALTNVTLPAVALDILSVAKENLTTVTLTSGETIENFSFFNFKNLTSVTLPESLITIGLDAFSDCEKLADITIPEKVTTIGYSAFGGCKSLTSVTVPASVTYIGYFAFDDCNKLTEINVADGNTKYSSIDGHLYSKDGKELIRYAPANTARSFTLQDDVTTIESKAFADCLYLTEIDASQNNAYFSSVDGNLYSKDGKTLVQYALGKAAQSFTVPSAVTNIEHYAFNGCEALTSVTLTEKVTSIGYAAFDGCVNLKYNEENGLKYLGTSTNKYLCLIDAADDVTTATINGNCKVIGYGAFNNHEKLESVSIPDSVIYVNSYAFGNCDGLTSVTIGNGLTMIGYHMFYDCDSLMTVELSNNVDCIGYKAFYSCDNLTSIVIPYGVSSVETEAFYDCVKLTIYCEAASETSGWEPDWDWNVKKVIWGYTGE